MTFTMAIKRLKPGMSAKTLSMSGYVRLLRQEIPYSEDYPNIMSFIRRDGSYAGEYHVSDDGRIMDYMTSAGDLSLDPELFNEILSGEWSVIPTDEAESKRTNPGTW